MLWFHFSGHGSRQHSAPEFNQFYPEGLDETLVCYNSRLIGQFDLADKEIAVLLSEINAGHILVSFDCCHSGSGVRDDDDPEMVRTASNPVQVRPLQSYIDGYYQTQLQSSGKINIPDSKHILIAACNRFQLAKEHHTGIGVFTKALTSVLNRFTVPPTYLELFWEIRSTIFGEQNNQTPQFQNYGGASALLGFLGQTPGTGNSMPRETIYAEGGNFYFPLGSIHGLTLQSLGSEVDVIGHDSSITSARIKDIGPERSEISIASPPQPFEFGKHLAQVHAFRHKRISLSLSVSSKVEELIRNHTPQYLQLEWGSPKEATRYAVAESKGRLHFTDTRKKELVQVAPDLSEKSITSLISVIEQVLLSKRFLNLESPQPIDPFFGVQTGLWLLQHGRDDVEYRPQRSETFYDPADIGFHPQFRVTNSSGKPLYFSLFYVSRRYVIRSLANEYIPSGKTEVVLWGSLEGEQLYIPEAKSEVSETFQMIISETQVQSYFLERHDLEIGGIIQTNRDLAKRGPLLKRWMLRSFKFQLKRNPEAGRTKL